MKYLKLYLLLLATIAATSTMRAQRVMTLQDAVESACLNNADLQKKRLDVEAMREVKKEIYTKYFPEVSISATGYWRNKGFAQGSDVLNTAFSLFASFKEEDADDIDAKILKYGVLGGLKAVLPLYTGGRLTSGNKLAQLGVKAKGEMVAIKEEELTQEVEKYFWQLVQLYEADEMLDTMDSLVDRARQDASLALKAGLVTTNDKMEVDLYASELESTHLQLDNGKKLCRKSQRFISPTR